MTITIRLQASSDDRGELANELHELPFDVLPDRVQHQIDAHHTENYDLRWEGDVVRKDEHGFPIYGFVGTDTSSPMPLGRAEHAQVGKHSRCAGP